MMPDDDGVPIKVKFQDKRRSATRPATDPAVETAAGATAAEADAGSGVQPVRESSPDGPAAAAAGEQVAPRAGGGELGVGGPGDAADVAETRDYLEDLRRLQADFENYRKRMMREQAETGSRAVARLVEKLLPVLDNFERAVRHGQGGEGVQLVFKELQEVLAQAGLEEIPSQGEPFDPNVHEAVASVEDDVDEPHVKEVFRRGYRMAGRVLRPSMVVVARPREVTDPQDPSDAAATADDAATAPDVRE